MYICTKMFCAIFTESFDAFKDHSNILKLIVTRFLPLRVVENTSKGTLQNVSSGHASQTNTQCLPRYLKPS